MTEERLKQIETLSLINSKPILLELIAEIRRCRASHESLHQLLKDSGELLDVAIGLGVWMDQTHRVRAFHDRLVAALGEK